MNVFGKKKHIILIITLSVVCAVVFLVLVASPLLAIGFEGVLVQININNPYVNSNFAGWQFVSAPGFKGFCIPEGWSFLEDNGLYTIRDETGKIWAYGAPFGTEDRRFESYKTLIYEVGLASPKELTFDPFTKFGMMDGSDIDKIIIQETNTYKEVYCIQFLKDTQTELAWFLTVDLSTDQTQYEIAEAFVFSYAFKTD